MLFDLLRLYGVDLTARSARPPRHPRAARARRAALADTPDLPDDGAILHDATKEQGLEGIVSKRVDSPYLPASGPPPGSSHPTVARSVVVGGWRPESTGTVRDRLGAVLVGVPAPGGLRYLGRVGAGLAGKAAGQNARISDRSTPAGQPFVTEVPAEDALGAQWVQPVIVVDVQSLDSAARADCASRVYKGVRSDLAPGGRRRARRGVRRPMAPRAHEGHRRGRGPPARGEPREGACTRRPARRRRGPRLLRAHRAGHPAAPAGRAVTRVRFPPRRRRPDAVLREEHPAGAPGWIRRAGRDPWSSPSSTTSRA